VIVDEYLYAFNAKLDAEPPLDRAMRAAQSAIRHAPESAWAHLARARVSFYRHDLSLFRNESETSISLAPNNSQILATVGHFLAYSGSWQEGMALMNRAVMLNPRHQTWYHFPYFYEAYRQGRDDEALAAAQKLNMPGFFWSHQVLASAYAQLGMRDEAAEAVTKLQELWPGYSIEKMAELHTTWNFEDDVIARMAEGLRKAGLPEGTD
jgi:tetratricopeptide (TPR) repeat protein